MDELIELVGQRTGISEDQARQAVETVLGFLKERLPGPIAGQIEAVVGEDDVSGILGGVTGGLGGMFG